MTTLQDQFETVMEDHLINNTAVNDRIGERLYPLRRPEDAEYPHAVYRRISRLRYRSHDFETGLGKTRMQIDSFGLTYRACKLTAEDIKISMLSLPGAGSAGVQIDRVAPQGDQDNFMKNAEDFRNRIDYVITHDEATS